MPFQPQKNLPKGTIFSAKDVQFSKDRDSGAMKQILQNKKISGVLDKVEERGEFYKVLREQAGGKGKGVDRDAVRKTLGYFRSGKGKHIDTGEVQKIAGEFSGTLSGKNYIFTKEERNADKPTRNNPVVSPRGENTPVIKPKSSSGGVTRHSKLF